MQPLSLKSLFSCELFTSPSGRIPLGSMGLVVGGPSGVTVLTPPLKAPCCRGRRQQEPVTPLPYWSPPRPPWHLPFLSIPRPPHRRETWGEGRQKARLASFGRPAEPKQPRASFREQNGRHIEKSLFHVFLYNLQPDLSFPLGKAADCGL